MKILIDDVKGEKGKRVIEINSLEELKELCLKYNLTLIEVYDPNHLGNEENQKWYKEEFMMNCDIRLTEHNDYIE